MTTPTQATRRRGERGQILVLFAGGLTLLVLLIGLVVDGGTAFVNRRDAQNDADLAAMAGAKIVKDFYVSNPALRSPDVRAAIAARMTANDCVTGVGTPCSWSAEYIRAGELSNGNVSDTANSPIPAGTVGVVVHVSRQPRTYFLGIIGQSSWQVAADATAITFSPPASTPGTLLPIGTNPPNPFEVGSSYVLTDTAPYGPAAFGWLSWTGANATGILANSICTPDNPTLNFPVNIPGEPGAHNGIDVRNCLDYWIANGVTVLIPVFDTCSPCNGNNASFHVTGLAAFVLTSYDSSGPAITTITGNFVGTYSGSSVPAGLAVVPPSAADEVVILQLYR